MHDATFQNDYVYAGMLGTLGLTLPTLAQANEWMAFAVGFLGLILGLLRLYTFFVDRRHGSDMADKG
jgi:hypothetical protein